MNRNINSWAVFGERGSGTRWLSHIMDRRAQRLQNLTNSHITGWKHGFWGERQESDCGKQLLCLIVKKDIFAWVLSLKAVPYHMPQFQGLPLGEFIRKEYFSICDSPLLKIWNNEESDTGELPERMPSGERWPNIIRMWKAKYDAWESINPESHPVMHIDYGALLLHPEGFQSVMTNAFGVQMYGPPIMAEDYPKRDFYLEKKYMVEWTDEDIEFVNQELAK